MTINGHQWKRPNRSIVMQYRYFCPENPFKLHVVSLLSQPLCLVFNIVRQRSTDFLPGIMDHVFVNQNQISSGSRSTIAKSAEHFAPPSAIPIAALVAWGLKRSDLRTYPYPVGRR